MILWFHVQHMKADRTGALIEGVKFGVLKKSIIIMDASWKNNTNILNMKQSMHY